MRRFFITLCILLAVAAGLLYYNNPDKFHSYANQITNFNKVPKRNQIKQSEFNAAKLELAFWDKKLVGMSSEEFIKKYARHLEMHWGSSARRQMRSITPLPFQDYESAETIVYFDTKGQLKKLELSIYNRGDFGNIAHSALRRVSLDLLEGINRKTRVEPLKKKFSRNYPRYSFYWLKAPQVYCLDYGPNEYIMLSAKKGIKYGNISSFDRETTLKPFQLRKFLKHKKNGDVYLSGIPMVDQGQKGYCACASTARLLQFFGRTVNQHDIAQMTQTGQLGTGLHQLRATLKKIGFHYRFRAKEIDYFPLSSAQSIQKYWKILKRSSEGNPLPVGKLEREMIKDRKKIKKFQLDIKKAIDGGRPLLWALYLGIVPENREVPQAFGGHMRLIIGYNKKTNELLFSDSWGPDHELKRIRISHAFIPTMAVWSIQNR